MRYNCFGLLLVAGSLFNITNIIKGSVPCIDKTTSCSQDLCGGFVTITYDVCRKTCNSCDGPVLDYASGNIVTEKVTDKTTIKTTTVPSTTTPTTTPTTSRPTTTPTTTSTTTRSTTTPTTTTTTTPRPTTTSTTVKFSTTRSTIKSTQTTKPVVTSPTVCTDKIPSTTCRVNSNTVCGQDYHFTYDLCRKTCGQCSGPLYTTNTPPIFTTSGSDISNKYREIECFHEGHSQQYDGRISVTSPSNHTCVNWASIAFLNGYKTTAFPDGDFNNNYCRDPDITGEPYCHTLYGKETCGIMKCPGQCKDSPTVSCQQFGQSACQDDEFARTICPLTCKKCGYGIVIEGGL